MIATSQRILIVDDESDIRSALRSILEGEDFGSFEISEAETGKAALQSLTGAEEGRPDLVLLDHYLADMQGTEILQEMINRGIETPVILMTGRAQSSGAIQAIQMGAFDYMSKPFDIDEVVNAVTQALRQTEHKKGNAGVDMPEVDPTEKIIGRGPEMMRIFRTIGLVARTQKTVLITGENGTGKSLLAETIHLASDRRRGPFVAINCAGIPETLLETELFGYVKGAFTGAVALRIGRFESADKGTIFLDEIGEMSLGMQSKLLKVLQDHQIERVGSNETIKIDVRVITATNKNLSLEVQERHFRQDLYFRLNVFPIHMPSLRDRKHDIPALVAHFMTLHRFSPITPSSRITQEALDRLEAHDWPGNVRELENVIQRAVIFSRGELILPEHITFGEEMDYLVLDIAQRVKHHMSMSSLITETQSMAIRAAMRLCDNNVARAAEMLSLDVEAFEALRTEVKA